MGPVSRDSLVKRQESDDEFKSAVLDEFTWLRETLNKFVGKDALDKETFHERLERLEKRVARFQAT